MMLGVSFTPVGKMLRDFPWEVIPIVFGAILILIGIMWGCLWLMGIRHLSDLAVTCEEDEKDDY